MNKHLETLAFTRKYLLAFISDLSVEELNEIPHGFNNNIIWNLAHLVSAQQGVCYKRAQQDIVIDEIYFAPYRPDTKPERFIGIDEIDAIKRLLLTTVKQLEIDYNNNLFSNYQHWTTRYGVELKSIDDALAFLPFHEGMHIGYIMALKRVVKNIVK